MPRKSRILANRQSAARSKERRMRLIAELERKIQTLQAESTSLSAQLAHLQSDSKGLSVQNNELKLHLQTMEQRLHMALDDALKDESQHLKILAGQILEDEGQMMNFAAPPPAVVPPFGSNSHPFYPQNNNKNTAVSMDSLLTAEQFQQLQIHSQKQQHHFQQQLQQLQQKQEEQSGDIKVKGGPMPTSPRKENSFDVNPHSSVPKIEEKNEIDRGFP